MWLFDIDLSNFSNINYDIKQHIKYYNDKPERIKALSLLSPEQVEKIGTLKGEAILGFVTGEQLSLESFHHNRIFIDFIQNLIGIEAPKDPDLQAAASEQQKGWIYIIDRRVTDSPQEEETSPEDIFGAFEIKDGQILANSYQPNDNYLIFSKNGLFQLPDSLNQSLISALEAL